MKTDVAPSIANPPWHSLAAKRIWITGGAGHLGAPITAALDQAGAQTICIDLNQRADALVASAGLKNTVPVSFDACNAEAVATQFARLAKEHGAPDGVVHLAYASSAGRHLAELSPAEFQRTLDLSLPSTFVLCRTAADLMKERRSGSVVLFSSMYGVVSPNPGNYPPPMPPNPIDYGAIKAAMLQMSRYFATHYGPFGVRFNCIVPGPFSNPSVQQTAPEHARLVASHTVLNRIGRREEIVGPTLFLLTDSASFVTGTNLMVDGGWTSW